MILGTLRVTTVDKVQTDLDIILDKTNWLRYNFRLYKICLEWHKPYSWIPLFPYKHLKQKQKQNKTKQKNKQTNKKKKKNRTCTRGPNFKPGYCTETHLTQTFVEFSHVHFDTLIHFPPQTMNWPRFVPIYERWYRLKSCIGKIITQG